jgi:mono/diheme cytochrome c family protein
VAAGVWSIRSFVIDVPPTPPPSSRPAGAGPGLEARVFAPTDSRTDVGASARESTATQPRVTSEAADRGATLYGRNGCVVCHGVRAEGLIGPRIAGTHLSLTAVRQQVRLPLHPRMPAFAQDQLSDEGIAAIYAFLQSLGAD